ncbi:efflux RND transporter periplasmic adaptor subunit [Arthrobacter silvisoli]|uniref:efflux RND transporter periplasmic adaptor subunit n=1 Tax=Arthrobacter silvisoli TaxID=2291022 RepID=UPI00109BB959|nr:efflux RND transporter periplasmic adaptor subunit [Arthrobacter silvisoli]
MSVFRRVVLPVAWLLVFAVIALALVKIAFIDGLRSEESGPAPMAQVGTPAVPAVRATVTNTVQLKATVQSDPAQAVRSTAAGTVVYIYRDAGTTVAKGEAVIQVRTEQPREAGQATEPGEEAAEEQSSEPVYVYTDVPAPRGGKVSELGVLIDQQVTVGETVGKVDPGSYTVSGPVTAAQQFRLLGKPGSAEIALTGGPAPFTCPEVTLKNNASDAGASGGGTGGGTGAGGMAVAAGGLQPAAVAVPGGGGEAPQDGGPATGTLSCAIPSGTEVFAGLGATMTVTAGESKNVITVPLSSVKGSVKEGIVWLAGEAAAVADAGAAPGAAPGAPGAPVREAREPEQRRVKLGLNDGSKVEVTSGLAEGDMVLEFVPGAAANPAMPGPGQMMYGPAGG